MNGFGNRPTKIIECEHCGNNGDVLLYETRFLVINKVLCEYCLRYKTDEELGIEPMESGE